MFKGRTSTRGAARSAIDGPLWWELHTGAPLSVSNERRVTQVRHRSHNKCDVKRLPPCSLNSLSPRVPAPLFACPRSSQSGQRGPLLLILDGALPWAAEGKKNSTEKLTGQKKHRSIERPRGRKRATYRVASVDVRVVLEVLEDLVEVSVAGGAQEARLRVRLRFNKTR